MAHTAIIHSIIDIVSIIVIDNWTSAVFPHDIDSLDYTIV